MGRIEAITDLLGGALQAFSRDIDCAAGSAGEVVANGVDAGKVRCQHEQHGQECDEHHEGEQTEKAKRDPEWVGSAVALDENISPRAVAFRKSHPIPCRRVRRSSHSSILDHARSPAAP
jgi:hypothetical protein